MLTNVNIVFEYVNNCLPVLGHSLLPIYMYSDLIIILHTVRPKIPADLIKKKNTSGYTTL